MPAAEVTSLAADQAAAATHDPSAGTSSLPVARRWYVCFALFLVLFAVFTYNSGYGYDAREYLILGRSLARGRSLYELVPSKSFGIYAVSAALQSVGLGLGHTSLTAVIVALAGVTIGLTFYVVRRVLSHRVAVGAATLMAVCCPFMELNFFQPVAFVACCGLAAYGLVCLSVDDQRPNSRFIAAGMLLAASMHFKTVGLLYLGPLLAYVVWMGQPGVGLRLQRGAALVVGLVIGLLSPAIYFAANGYLGSWWEWTFEFPLAHYPPNTSFLSKLVTKLGWFHILLAASIYASLNVSRSVWRQPRVVLALLLGLASDLALGKNQASHYCVPGAPFFAIFMAAVGSELTATITARRLRAGVGLAVVSVSLMALSLAAFQPTAVRRLFTWNTYSEETYLADLIQTHTRPADRAIFTRDSTLLYWVSGLEPALAVPNFDVQTTYYFRDGVEPLRAALDDPRTTIVEFGVDLNVFDDPAFVPTPQGQAFIALLRERLERDFEPISDSPGYYRFWVRKPEA